MPMPRTVLQRLFFLILSAAAALALPAQAGNGPEITDREALDLVIQKFSSDPNTESQAVLAKSARDDLIAGRKAQAKAKFALLASLYEGLVDEQIAAIQAAYSEAVLNMSSMPWVALEASTGTLAEQAGAAFRGADPRRLIDPSRNGNEYSAERIALLERAATDIDAAMSGLSRFLKKATPKQLAHFRKELPSFEILLRESIESIGQRHSTAGRRATLLEIAARRLQTGKKLMDKGTLLTRMQCADEDGKEGVLRAYVNAETVGQSLFAASMLIGVGEVMLGARAALAVTKGAASAFTKVGWQAAAKASLNESARIATGAAARKALAEKFASNVLVRGTHGASRAAIGTLAGMNIYEAVTKHGVLGLANLGSAIDVLTLLAVMPRPTAFAVAAREQAETLKYARLDGTKFRGIDAIRAKLIDTRASMLKTIVSSQHQAGSLVAGLGTSYGVYQIVMAERLAKEMGELGDQVSPEEVKKQGISNILMGLASGRTAHAEYKAWASKQNPRYFTEMLSEAQLGPTLARLGAQFKKNWVWFPIKDLGRELKITVTGKATKAHLAEMQAAESAKPFLEQKPVRTTQTGRGSALNTRLDGAKHVVGASVRIAYDLAAYHAFALIAFAYPDMSFRADQRPLPDLKEGEIALVLSSFDRGDLLRGAMKTVHSLRRMRDKYQEGVNYFEDEFADPADLLRKIRFYSTHFGKIRMLEIKAHGVPGIIATKSLDISGGGASGVIDAPYMKKNAKGIQAIASEAMAPDAAVYIFSCMVGSNLDRPIIIGDHPAIIDPATGKEIKPASKGIQLPVRSGDEFIDAFKKTFLVNGGTVNSSRRMIAAFDAVHGSGLHAALLSGIKKNPKALAEFRKYVGSRGSFLLDPAQDTEENRAAYLAGIGSKVLTMYKKMWGLINNYGISLEGNFFTEKHRIDTAKAQTPSKMSAAELEAFQKEFNLDRRLTPNERRAFLESARLASEISGQPMIERDLREMLENDRVWYSPALETQALTFLAYQRKPFLLIGSESNAWMQMGAREYEKGRTLEQLLSPSNPELKSSSLREGILMASTLAHEWFHAKQGFDYRMKTKNEDVEWEAYSFEVTFQRQTMKLYEAQASVQSSLQNGLSETAKLCWQATGRSPKGYTLSDSEIEEVKGSLTP